MNFTFLLYTLMFLIMPLGFILGGGKLFELRNYHYIVISFSILGFIFYKINIIKNSFFSFSEPSKYCKYFLIITSFFAFIFDILSQYYGLSISGIDFSIFEGMLQNSIAGNWGFEDITNIYHFGVHQNWILLLIFPFYYLLPSPILLLIIGALLIWLPGILIIYLVKKLGYNDFIAYLSSIFWWISPFTVQALHGNFYPEFFYPIFIFSIIIFYLEKKYLLLLLFTFLFLCVKEESFLYILGFLMAIFLKNILSKTPIKFPYYILFIILLMILFFVYLNFFITKPYFLNKQNIHEVGYLNAWWGKWGNTPLEIVKSVLFNPLDVFINIFNSSGWKRLYIPLLFIPFLNLEVLFASIPIIFLYGIANGNPSNYSGYYPLVLWCLAVYGLFNKKLIPNWIIIIILFITPLLQPSWLGVERIKWREWNDIMIFKKQMNFNNLYCVHPGLWPYLSSLNLNVKNFYDAKNLNCSPVFSTASNPYPQNIIEMKNLYEKTKKMNCIKYQLGSIVEVKNTKFCKDIINNI
ncbi:DUF2079 domain-containing protein [Fluviispira multicolorata]|uniref:DUF2079 domain-containing protein n=1 Tax=Fluviispira multicolorata TaxID=2654512 RepID=A0A833N562_9BACT|nr:DUF2079 domain-containing protein [Fluviispira multicolorata]KAB8029852.1 DUF2079 domain-containing protein [Fluviispira multicolorata]